MRPRGGCELRNNGDLDSDLARVGGLQPTTLRLATPAFRVEGTVVSTRILQALWARLFGRAHQIRNLLESRCDKKLVAVAMSTKKPCDKWLVFHPKLGMHRAQCRTATAPQTQPLHDARAHGQVAPPPARRAHSKTMASPTSA